MTMKKLDEIATRAKAATIGPWEATPNDRIVSSNKNWPEGDPYDVAGMFGNKGAVVEACRTNDANFIANARKDVPALVRTLRGVLAIHSCESGGTPLGDFANICGGCQNYWPCPTVLLIEDVLEGNNDLPL